MGFSSRFRGMREGGKILYIFIFDILEEER